MTVPPPGPDTPGQPPHPEAPLNPYPNAQVPAPTPEPAPLPQPPYQGQPYPQQPYPAQGFPQQPGAYGAPYGQYGPPKPRMGKAITSLVLGLSSVFLCFCWFLTIPMAIVGIILSVLAQRDVKRGTGGGNGMAIAGLVLGIVGVIFSIVAIFIWLDPGFQADFWDGFCEEEPDSEFCRNR